MPTPVLAALSLLLSLLAASAAVAQNPSAAPKLRIHGSNTIGEHLLPALLQALAAERGHAVSAIEETAENERRMRLGGVDVSWSAHGSSTGFRFLLSGDGDIAMSSRPVTAAEVEAAERHGLGELVANTQEFVVALDGIAIIVHPDNPLTSIDMTTLRRIFTGEIRSWSQLGGRATDIRALARDENSGTYDTFRSLVLTDERLVPSASRHESTDELAEQVASDPGAIGFVGLGGIGRARALSIHDAGTLPLPPQAWAVAVEDYLLSRRLYLYLPAKPSPAALALAQFAISDAGQTVVERNGFVSQAIQPFEVSVGSTAPELYRSMTRGARRLPLNLRYAAGTSTLDNKALIDIERLVRYARSLPEGSYGLRLFGFADAHQTMPFLSVILAHERIDFLSGHLSRKGVSVQHARGLGANLPVASNATDWGRQRNRRVEVWLTQTAP